MYTYITYACSACHRAFDKEEDCTGHERECTYDEKNKHCDTCKWARPGARCNHPDGCYLCVWSDGNVHQGPLHEVAEALNITLIECVYSRMHCPGWTHPADRVKRERPAV